MLESANPRDLDEVAELLALAFGFDARRASEYLVNIGLETMFVVRDGSKLAACAALLETRQRFGGAWIPSAAIAHLAVAPEARGRGLAIPLVGSLCSEAASRGAAMVTLFASARPVYRKAGFELAGSEMVYEAKTSALPVKTDLDFRRIDLKDHRIREAYDAKTLVEAGLIDRSEGLWRELLREPRHALAAYGVGESDLAAYVVVDAADETCLVVRDWFAPTAAAARGVLVFLGRFRSVFPVVRWHGGPHDELVSAMPDKGWRLFHQEEWLARIIEPEMALAVRGYPRTDASLGLSISDPDGRGSDFVLDVADGIPTVRTGAVADLPTLRLDRATFATAFTGFRSVSRLARQGLVAGDPDAVRLGDLLFYGPPPWLAEHV